VPSSDAAWKVVVGSGGAPSIPSGSAANVPVLPSETNLLVLNRLHMDCFSYNCRQSYTLYADAMVIATGRALVAALNWGHRYGYFETDRPWRAVGPFPVSDGQRDGYVSDVQRIALRQLAARILLHGHSPWWAGQGACPGPEWAREEPDRDQREEQNGGGQTQGLSRAQISRRVLTRREQPGAG
jgi:hypothetical protein